jgi:GNAT superfamily N-acetyltransferase
VRPGGLLSYGFEAFRNPGGALATITRVALADDHGLRIPQAWIVPITGTCIDGVVDGVPHLAWVKADGPELPDNAGVTVAVRGAATTDAAAIADLMTQLGYPATADEISRRLGYWLRDRASQILLAVCDGTVVGCLSLHAVPYLERTGRWARIESFIIDEAARGSGVGTTLLAAAEELAREWGCLSVEVTSSRTREDAHAFYRKAGYTDICAESARFVKPLS